MRYNISTDWPWSFVVFRTYYVDDELWEKAKANLEESHLLQADSIAEEGRILDTATYVYMEDEARYDNKSTTDIRL